MKIFYGLLAVLIIASCSTPKEADKTSEYFPGENSDSLVASIERTRCYGTCPVYKICFYRSGYILYEGYDNVEQTGRFYTYIPFDKLISIGEKAVELNYFSLNDEYRNPYLTDYPTVYTEVRFRGMVKKITHYDAEPPGALVEMEKYLDSIANNPTLNWNLHPDQNIKD